jgi:stage II sporulation protein AA (anti-sigma F factor antagonist)
VDLCGLDAAGLTYISRAGLSLLLQVAKQLKERSGRMVLCALQGPVKRVLEIAGCMSLFSIFSCSEEAVQDCRRD